MINDCDGVGQLAADRVGHGRIGLVVVTPPWADSKYAKKFCRRRLSSERLNNFIL